jgi:small multidrug resistance family-3 protein
MSTLFFRKMHTTTQVNEKGETSAKTSDEQQWNFAKVSISLSLFLLAGLLEIGGGWLVWIYVRGRDGWAENGHAWWVVLLGSLLLVCYGFAPTLQPLSDFGRIYAAYGGFFIVLSFIWASIFDGFVPDKGDLIGGLISLVGVLVILFWPRS